MTPPRYLCSHLVQVSIGGRTLSANLEQIGHDSAVLECEEEISSGAGVEIRCSPQFTALGAVVQSKEHGFGWTIGVRFLPWVEWSIERFRPDHLLDLDKIQKEAQGAA